MNRLRHNVEDEGDKRAGWLTTFNDLVTLLMVFFVLLFTMSTIDTKKMQDFQYALQSGLGILETGNKVAISVKRTQPVDDMSHIMTQAEGELNKKGNSQVSGKLVDQIRQMMDNDPDIQVTRTDQETRLSFEDQVLFDFGKAAINPAGFVFLDKIADVLDKIPYAVRVEGHTDNVPIRTRRFPSNWELSVARAVSVVKYFVEVSNINPQRLSAVGYGESRPVAENDTLSNRAKNRRVEILLLTEGKEENVE
ncbi:MAG: flagellar motor protein MotB [Desulfobacterales bacterium]